MRQSDWDTVIATAMEHASKHLASLPERRAYQRPDIEALRTALGEAMPANGTPPEEVVDELGHLVEPYLAGHATGRYFGFVVGGLHPASYGADLLVSTWDQNAGLYPITPGVALVEETAARWLVELLRLPEDSSVGFVTGGQMATFTCLAAARDQVLRESGWNVESDGLQGSPPISLLVKADGHATVNRAARFLGLGDSSATEIECDDQSRMSIGDLEEELSVLQGPAIVCLESGNINTGSFDYFDDVMDRIDAYRQRGNPVWVHVDGAVGLFARASSRHESLTEGLERCDSWSTDAHKLLNVGYDSGIAITRHPAAHRAAMSVQSSYLIQAEGDTRDPLDWNPEHSRRARGVAVYATLKSLGASGVDDLVGRACAMARRFAESLERSGLAEVHNDVVLNQVLVRWLDLGGDHDTFNNRLIEAVQSEGSTYFTGTTWHGMRLMRISVSDWATDEDDVDHAISVLTNTVAELATPTVARSTRPEPESGDSKLGPNPLG